MKLTIRFHPDPPATGERGACPYEIPTAPTSGPKPEEFELTAVDARVLARAAEDFLARTFGENLPTASRLSGSMIELNEECEEWKKRARKAMTVVTQLEGALLAGAARWPGSLRSQVRALRNEFRRFEERS